jgi:hypothetical protein
LRTDQSRIAWLLAAPAVLAAFGAVLPWFAPSGTRGGVRAVEIPRAYCVQAGHVGFLAPLLLIVAGVSLLGPRLRRTGARPGGDGASVRPLAVDGLILLGCGVAAAIVLVLTWYLLPSSYTFTGGLSWDALERAGFDLRRGPRAGYFLTVAAAVLAIGCGAALVLAGRRNTPGRIAP